MTTEDPRPSHPAASRGHPGDDRSAPLLGAEHRPARIYLARLAPTGRRVQATALTRIAALLSDGAADADTLPWGRRRYAHTQAVRAHLAARYAPATANRMLAALRGVLTEAWRLGQMDAEDLHRAIDLPPVRGARPPAGRHVAAAELAAVLAHCPDSPAGRRDAALIALLYGTGARRSEALALDVADLDLDPDPEPGPRRVAGSVRVRGGKGGKQRVVYLPAGAADALRAWLGVRGPAPGPLFCPIRRGGHLVAGARLTGAAVGQILSRRAEAAGVARFRAHDLRRTLVGDLLEAGADLATVARICGHARPGTTARYDRRAEQPLQRAAGLVAVPFPTAAPAGSEAAPGPDADPS